MSNTPSAELILAGLPGSLILVATDHRIAAINQAAESFLGTSAKHLVGEPVAELIEFGDQRLQKALLDNQANMAARGTAVSIRGHEAGLVDINIQPLAADPDWRIISLSSVPAEGPPQGPVDGGISDFSFRAPDILGHEIKNPLAAIKGAAQLLDRSLDNDQKSLTKMIKSEVERITDLLNSMQGLSTTRPANVEPVNIHSLIDRTRDAIEAAAYDTLKIRDQFDPSLPDVLVDPDAMMQVLTNLLSNAVEATNHIEKRDIQVTTRYSFGASFSSNASDQAVRLPVEIIIRDNGSGVPAELENQIFSPFVTTKQDGQGLGLALVRKLIGDMHGRVRYERDASAGYTQFSLFLPIANSAEKQSQKKGI